MKIETLFLMIIFLHTYGNGLVNLIVG